MSEFAFLREFDATAFLFPGQGSQFVGMGQELASAYPVAQETFEEADDLLGFGLSRLCFDGPEEMLTDTVNAQPALLATSVACLRVLQQEIGRADAATDTALLQFLNQQKWAAAYEKNQTGQNTVVIQNTGASSPPITLPLPVPPPPVEKATEK